MKRLLLLILIACPMTIRAGTCPLGSACQPGDVVNVTSPSLDKGTVTLSPKVTLASAKATGGNFDTPLQSDVTTPKMSFVIPKEIPDGTYLIQIKKTPRGETSAAMAIDDLSPSEIVVQRPIITAVSPTAAFRDDRSVNKLTILGSGFRKDASTFHFTKRATPPQCANGIQSQPKKGCYDLSVDGDERQITLSFHALDPNDGYFAGPQEFAIRVDGLDTNTSSFSLIDSSQGLPTTVALIGLALIVGIVYFLIQSGKEVIKQTFGTKTYLLGALFLDVQTSSYSLSKCQFYAWTAAAVLGYLFLAVSKSFVQGSATFPDIPSGLPGILLASVGTAVLSTGIASAKGDKGAGNPEPNLSDFITTGGVVAADRLQFAIWTVVGIATFLAIIFKSDPRNINDLPSIPSGFLELMGISAGGYLAGKLARKPGPTLAAIAIKGKPSELTFQLTGSGLSQSAIFSIDGATIFPDTIRRETGSDSKLPNVVQADPTIGDPNFARMLQFTCQQPKDEWLGGPPHSFTITNPDSQKATISFKIFKVDKIEIAAADTAGKATLTITGKCLDEKFVKVKYMKTGSSLTDVPEPKFENDQTLCTATLAGLSEGDTVTVTIADTAGVEDTRVVTVQGAPTPEPAKTTPTTQGAPTPETAKTTPTAQGGPTPETAKTTPTTTTTPIDPNNPSSEGH